MDDDRTTDNYGDFQNIRVAIVGGGAGCRDVLALLLSTPLRHLRIKVVGVADIHKDAPGLCFAREHGIPTTDDFRDFFREGDNGQTKPPDLVIELTGSDEVLRQIFAVKPESVKVLDHVAARLFWELIELQNEKRAMEEHLAKSEKMASVAQIAFRLVHEMRNPLMIVGGSIRRLMLDPMTPHPIRKQLCRIVDNVGKMEHSIADICALAGPLHPHYERAELTDILNEWCRSVSRDARHHGVTINYLIDEALPSLVMDKGLIHQVLSEVTEKVLERMTRIHGNIEIGAKRENNHVVITVREVLPAVRDGSSSYHGAGYIPTQIDYWVDVCRKIIYDHKGDFQIRQMDDGGVMFVITLPISSAEHGAGEKERSGRV
ncbi:sensor histidine kinase [Desulfolithobacter sp.]